MTNYEQLGRLGGAAGGAGLFGALGRALEPLDYPRRSLWNLPGKLAEGDWGAALPGLAGLAAGGLTAATGVGLPFATAVGSLVGGLGQAVGQGIDEDRFRAPSAEDVTGSDNPLLNLLVGAVGDPLTYAGGLGGAKAGTKLGSRFGTAGVEQAAKEESPLARALGGMPPRDYLGELQSAGLDDPALPAGTVAGHSHFLEAALRNPDDELPWQLWADHLRGQEHGNLANLLDEGVLRGRATDEWNTSYPYQQPIPETPSGLSGMLETGFHQPDFTDIETHQAELGRIGSRMDAHRTAMEAAGKTLTPEERQTAALALQHLGKVDPDSVAGDLLTQLTYHSSPLMAGKGESGALLKALGGQAEGAPGGIKGFLADESGTLQMPNWLRRLFGRGEATGAEEAGPLAQALETGGAAHVPEAPMYENPYLKQLDQPQPLMLPAPAPPAPTFYSRLQRALEEDPGQQYKTQGLIQRLTGGKIGKQGGISPEEIQHVGLPGLLEGQPTITKSALLEHLQQHGLNVEPKVLGATPERAQIDELRRQLAAMPPVPETGLGANAKAALRGYGVPNTLIESVQKSLSPEFGRGTEYAADNLAGLERFGVPKETIDQLQYLPGASQEYMGQAKSLSDRILELEQQARGTAAKWPSYQTPGGENYKETLLTLPLRGEAAPLTPSELSRHAELLRVAESADMPHWAPGQQEEYLALANRLQQAADKNVPGTFYSSHFDQPNVLAHLRTNERTLPGTGPALPPWEAFHGGSGETIGRFATEEEARAAAASVKGGDYDHIPANAGAKRALHGEEIQSDWHQAGKEHGYGPVSQEEIAALQKEIDARGRDAEAAITRLMRDQIGPYGDRMDGARRAAGRDPAWLEAQAALRDLDLRQSVLMKDRRVPDAPFKQAWPDLALKQLLHDAAAGGFDAVTWLPGEAAQAQVGGKLSGQAAFYGSHLPDAELGQRVLEEIQQKRPELLTAGQRKLEAGLVSPEQYGAQLERDADVPARMNKLLKALGGGQVMPQQIVSGGPLGFRADLSPEVRSRILKGLPYLSAAGGGALLAALANEGT